MRDTAQKIGDQKHIDVHDDGEVWYWTYKFGVSKQQLVAAVREVGTHTEDVAIQLGRSYPKAARPLQVFFSIRLAADATGRVEFMNRADARSGGQGWWPWPFFGGRPL